MRKPKDLIPFGLSDNATREALRYLKDLVIALEEILDESVGIVQGKLPTHFIIIIVNI